ncbi:hypothetical protein [Bdellovibrio bacteriovorus]|uniref:hypothetical protein n=1 Tax=Bdellovibrio bacteriovorus TaxID=959 RepID=UPI003D014A7A
MKFKNLTVLVLSGVVFMLAGEVFACRASRDMKHNFAVNFESAPPIRVYGDGDGSTILPQMIDKCTESAGSFLMLSKGVYMPSDVSDVADISLDGDLPDENICKIENPIFSKPMDHNQKKSLVKRQHKFLQQCAFVTVAEVNGRPLRYKANQDYCKTTAQGPSMVQMEGEYCFLTINPSYNLSITMGLKPECANPEKMKELGLEFGDIEAALNSYVAGDDSGLSPDVTAIGSSRYRFTLQAPANMMEMSEDVGLEAPRFPTTYNAEFNIGDLQFRQAGEERVDLNMYLSVDNRQPLFCNQAGLCTAPSAYNIPVAAEVEVYKIGSQKTTYIDGWNSGGTIQGNWQGLMRFPQQSIDGLNFVKGERYKVVVTMIDPFEDFYIYLNRAEQFLIDLKAANGVAGLDQIQSIQPLADLLGLPRLTGLPHISSGDLNSDLDMSLGYFKKLGATRLWPTYYERLCDPSHGQCYLSGKQKFWNRFSAEFTVGEVGQGGNFDLSDIRVIKESPAGVVMNKQVQTLPRYRCEP